MLDRYTRKLAELDLMRDALFHVRVITRREADRNVVEYVLAKGQCLAGVDRPAMFDYGRFTFVSGTVRGEELLSWISNGGGQLHSIDFSLRPIRDDVSVEHVPSQIQYGHLRGRLPTWRYSLSLREPVIRDRDEMLIAPGCPMFPDYLAAVMELLYERTPEEAQHSFPDAYVHIVVPEFEGYISGVQLNSLRIAIDVNGDFTPPISLHIYGERPALHQELSVTNPGTIIAPFPAGMPRRIRCVLANGHRWLDMREINSDWPTIVSYGDVSRDAADPETNLKAVISQGEGPQVEFKRDRTGDEDKWLKTVVAFANGQGGMIVFGVDDAGETIGVAGEANQCAEAISNAIHARVDPAVQRTVAPAELNGRQLVIVTVNPGSRKPYALVRSGSRRYYHRIGSTTFEAHPEDLRVILLSERPGLKESY